MAKLNDFRALEAVLRDKADRFKAENRPYVVVGYTQNYAIWVHENLNARHPVGKAKFLEGPARRLGRELAQMIRTAVAKGQTLAKALLLAGLRLQRESQLECPVEYGALRNSAFTRVENG